MKKLIQLKLKILSRMVLKKYHPFVIGITGSVGKTSTKEAVSAVLSKKYNVGSGIKNYNNEIGLPLVIVGAESPGRNIFGWFGVFFKVIKNLLFVDPAYPEILVLEMGIDSPGDMEYLTSIAQPNIAIVTAIGNVHLENFGTKPRLIKEKSDLVRAVQKDGWSILNYDDEVVRKMNDLSKAKVLTYGFREKADVQAIEINFSFKKDLESAEEVREVASLAGISFKLKYKGAAVPVLLPGVVGYNSIYASLAAASVGLALQMNLHEISEGLRNIKSPKGRMNLIPAIKHALIIDDTYNAEPKSVASGLSILAEFSIKNTAKKYAILGDMLELGSMSEEEHRRIGRMVQDLRIDYLVTVGSRALDINHGAIEIGMSEDCVFHFSNTEEAGKFVQERMHQGDLIFVKGSQGMRMEKIVKEIMAEPLRAEELLVRQDREWVGKI